MVHLLDEPKPADGTLIQDSFKRVRDQLAQIPDGKHAALVIAVDMKKFVPTLRSGLAYRTASGWEIHGEAFASAASKGASVVAVKSW